MVPENTKKVGLPRKTHGRPLIIIGSTSEPKTKATFLNRRRFALCTSKIKILNIVNRTSTPTYTGGAPLLSVLALVVHIGTALHFYLAVRVALYFGFIGSINMGTSAFGSGHFRVRGAEIGGFQHGTARKRSF